MEFEQPEVQKKQRRELVEQSKLAYEQGGQIAVSFLLADLILDTEGCLMIEKVQDLKEQLKDEGLVPNMLGHIDELVVRLGAIADKKVAKFFKEGVVPRDVQPAWRGFLTSHSYVHEQMNCKLASARGFFSLLLHPIRQLNGGYCFAVSALRAMVVKHPDFVMLTYLELLETEQIEHPQLGVVTMHDLIDPSYLQHSDHPWVNLFCQLLIFASTNYSHLTEPGTESSKWLPSVKSLLLEFFRVEMTARLKNQPESQKLVEFLTKQLTESLFIVSEHLFMNEAREHVGGLCHRTKTETVYFPSFAHLERFLLMPLLKEAHKRKISCAKWALSSIKNGEEIFRTVMQKCAKRLRRDGSWEKIVAEEPRLPLEGGAARYALQGVFFYRSDITQLKGSLLDKFRVIAESSSRRALITSKKHAFTIDPNLCAAVTPKKMKSATRRLLETPVSPDSKRIFLDELSTKGKPTKTWKDLFNISNDPTLDIEMAQQLSMEVTLRSFLRNQLKEVLQAVLVGPEEVSRVLKKLKPFDWVEDRIDLRPLAVHLSQNIQQILGRRIGVGSLLHAISKICNKALLIPVGDSNYAESRSEGAIYAVSGFGSPILVPPELNFNLSLISSPQKSTKS